MLVRRILFLLILFPVTLIGQTWLSHNDYEQDVPLHTAITNRIDIIEADIYLRDSIIVVCHDEDEIKNAISLTELYLDPLKKYNTEDIGGIILMLDIKKYSPMII